MAFNSFNSLAWTYDNHRVQMTNICFQQIRIAHIASRSLQKATYAYLQASNGRSILINPEQFTCSAGDFSQIAGWFTDLWIQHDPTGPGISQFLAGTSKVSLTSLSTSVRSWVGKGTPTPPLKRIECTRLWNLAPWLQQLYQYQSWFDSVKPQGLFDIVCR